MSLIDLLRSPLRSVSANKLRAVLTMLGVVIGVASVIAMLALGNGARAAVDPPSNSLAPTRSSLDSASACRRANTSPRVIKLTYLDGLNMPGAAALVERVEMSTGKKVRARFGRNAVEISASGVTSKSLEGL